MRAAPAATAITCAALGLLPGAASAQTVVLDDGHVDYAARIVSGQLRSQIKDGTQGADHVVWRDPANVVFKVNKAAKTTVPDNSRLAFLGPPGSATWMIPQVQKAGILWAGWNTEELTSADLDGPITWTLQAAEGPGTVAIFQTGSFGDPDVIFNSADGLPDRRQIALGVHAHANWAFSQPGTYKLTFAMTGNRPGGQPLSDVQTLDVLVVKADAGGVPPPGSSTEDPGSAPTSQQQPSPSSATGTSTTPGPSGGTAAPRLTLRAGGATLTGRVLRLTLQLSRWSRLDATVRHAGRVITRAKARTVAGSTRARTQRLLLGRTLKPGWTYTATIRARAAGRTVTKTLTLRILKSSRPGPTGS